MTDTIEGRDEQALIHVNTANMPRPAIPGFGRNREFGTARRESGRRISDTIERMREAARFGVSAPRQMPLLLPATARALFLLADLAQTPLGAALAAIHLSFRTTPDLGPDVFRPANGAWGRRGSTIVRLADADAATVRQALIAAWRNTAPKRLVQDHDEA